MKDLKYEKPLSQDEAEARDLHLFGRSLYFHIPGVAFFVTGLEALTRDGLFRSLLGGRSAAWTVLAVGAALLVASIAHTLKRGKFYADTIHKANPSDDELI
ncbi:MAG: hypothetical protein AAF662_05935 [Pseudomonadota bacterium]